jgi:hypothetical protein
MQFKLKIGITKNKRKQKNQMNGIQNEKQRKNARK